MVSTKTEETNVNPRIYKRTSTLSNFLNHYKKSKTGMTGLLILLLFVIMAITAPIIAPFDPNPLNVIGPEFSTPEFLRIFEFLAVKDSIGGNDVNCTNLTKWEVIGFNQGYLTGGAYDTDNPAIGYRYNDVFHYNLSDYNHGRDGLTISEISDDKEGKSDGKAFQIFLNTTEDDYSSGSSPVGESNDPHIILRQKLNWISFAMDYPELVSQIPSGVKIMLRYRVEYGGDLLNDTLYPENEERKHFEVKVRLMRANQEFDDISSREMKFPRAAEYSTYNPRDYYTKDDKLVSRILIHSVFRQPIDGKSEINEEVILQLEAIFDEVNEFKGSIKIVVDQFYIEMEDNFSGFMGTTGTGADAFSQLIYGSQVSLMVGVIATFFSVSLGLVVGLMTGFVGGKTDNLLMRLTDFLLVLPELLIIIILASQFAPSFWNVIIVISILGWTKTARIIRAQILSEKEKMYVKAAKGAGASNMYIMFRHILPNVLPIVFVQLAVGVSYAIQTEAAISFLGLGGAEISWGRMLQDASVGAITSGAWWLILIPGLCICLLSLSFILIGFTTEQIINPRLRKG
jgi:ABC-type dipeptide/oligopeptide/nickel transport system permease subunit